MLHSLLYYSDELIGDRGYCGGDMRTFRILQSVEAIKYFIAKANQNTSLLPSNIHLGYAIMDTCGRKSVCILMCSSLN